MTTIPGPHALSETVPRILDADTVDRVTQLGISAVQGGGHTQVTVMSWWTGELRWARNRVSLSSDRRDVQVTVRRFFAGARAHCTTNQLDEASLVAAVRAAERIVLLRLKRDVPSYTITPPVLSVPETQIWSDHTYNTSVEQRAALARVLVERAEPQALLSAGYLELRAGEFATRDTASATPDKLDYATYTQAQCSTTVRHPKGVGSGWAGLSSYDWAAIDSEAITTRALEKCLASLNPVAIEPGRYTVILEPRAVCSLIDPLVGAFGGRESMERWGKGPFVLGFDRTLGLWRTKLGLKIVDERITLSHDPSDPLLGVLPRPGLRPITWVDHGVLTTLSYDRDYALEKLHENESADGRGAYRMSGGTTSIDEMIRTTNRGVLVTRFSGLRLFDYDSLLFGGLTRDGLWLIEHGKISKAIKNMRFTESPLFMLNQVEQLGVPTPVFHPVVDPYTPGVRPVIVPPLKARDFSFTSMIDAV